ncbi:MAG: helix-turn-helix transcriptional regulator [Oscillospiraceae bacterium]|nr:helix-turn-helix transcriptional regulator [Oscillospiraceae bacterium]
MAHIEKREGKLGVSYRIIVSGGFDCGGNRIMHKKTWRPSAKMSERQAEKMAMKEAVLFEQSINQGYIADNKQTFAEYAQYVLQLKERIGKKHRTIDGYRRLLPRINAAIGHMLLQDIRPIHLNRFYQALTEEAIKIEEHRAVPLIDLRAELKEKGFSMMKAAKAAGVAQSTVNSACEGNAILADKAEAICKATGINFEKAFALRIKNKQLSSTTVLAYHRFIHTVLA